MTDAIDGGHGYDIEYEPEEVEGEIVEAHLPAVTEPRTLYPTLSVDELADMLERVQDAKNRILRSGLDADYAVIPGTGGKPTLLKPGAEKLCQLFGYRIMAMDKIEQTDDPFGVLYKCTLHDANGHVVGVCDGWCDAGETKAKRGRWDRNTIMKMAQKRAFVGATLWACNASAIFTQDVEDYDLGNERVTAEVTKPVPEKSVEQKGVEAYGRLVEWYQEYAKLDSPEVAEETVAMACKNVGYASTDDLAELVNEQLVRARLHAELRVEDENKQPEAPLVPDPLTGEITPGGAVLQKIVEEFGELGKDAIWSACKDAGITDLEELAEDGAYEWVITLLNERKEDAREGTPTQSDTTVGKPDAGDDQQLPGLEDLGADGDDERNHNGDA